MMHLPKEWTLIKMFLKQENNDPAGGHSEQGEQDLQCLPGCLRCAKGFH